MTTPSISIVIPVYNEENILEKNIRRLLNFLENKNINDFEIILSENGSTDNTLEKANKIAQIYSRIKVITVSSASWGEATRKGVAIATKDVILIYSIDLAFSLNFISESLRYVGQYPVVHKEET